MKRIYQEVIDTIPDYQVFLSPDELDESSRALAAEFPDTVTLFEVGATRKGRPLLCLRVGEPRGASGASAGEGIPLPDPQRPAALLLGVPHPNEPIGAMLIEHLSRCLAADADLRRELGYTWYFVKAWDADSLELNTWLKGPFNLTNYSRNIYRPAFYDQVEWTFPIDYKTLHFDAPLPETRAVMALVDAVRPRFVYSLHNSSFGGVYWYETHRTPEIWEEMRAIVADQGLDLHLGEAEVPYAERWAPALYRALSVRDQYDYLERYGEPGGDPAQAIDSGAASFDYACADGQAVGFINEIPYFYSEQIGDLTPTGRTKCDVMLERLDEEERDTERIRAAYEPVRHLMGADNGFAHVTEEFLGREVDDSTRAMVRENPEYAQPATVADEFDNLLVRRLFKARAAAQVARACEVELAKLGASPSDVGGDGADRCAGAVGPAGERPDEHAARCALEAARDTALAHHGEICRLLESKIDYEVIPIKKLVTVQLACGLLVADYVRTHDIA